MNEQERKEYFEEFLENNHLYQLYKKHKKKQEIDMKKIDRVKTKTVKEYALALMIFTGICAILRPNEPEIFLPAFTVCFMSFLIYSGTTLLIGRDVEKESREMGGKGP